MSQEKVSNETESERVALALKSLGFDLEGETDPEFMESLIKKVGVPQVPDTDAGKIVQRLSKEAIPLLPLRDKIVQALMQNEPLKKTILEAHEKQLHLNKDNADQIKSSVHFMVILEVMTTLMANDADFSNAVMDGMLGARGVKNTGDTVANFASITWNIGDVFAGVKAVSVDPGMWLYRCWREYDGNPTLEQCQEFIDKHGLTFLNANGIMSELDKVKANEHRGLRTNITEAIIAQPERARGECNQMAGFALTTYLEENKPNSTYSHGPVTEPSPELSGLWGDLYRHTPANNIAPSNDFPQEWVNLYESWNMAFTMNKFPDKFHLIFPKLLIPATLGAKPEFYMATRVPSLWLTINFINALSKDKDPLMSCPEQEDTQKLLSIWNANNFEAGQKLVEEMPLRHHFETQIKTRSAIPLVFSIMTGKHVSKHREFTFESLDKDLAIKSLADISKSLDNWEISILKGDKNESSDKKIEVIKALRWTLATPKEGSPQQNLKEFYHQFNKNRDVLTHNASTKEVKFIYQIFACLTTMYKNWQDNMKISKVDHVVSEAISKHYKNRIQDLKPQESDDVAPKSEFK